MRKSLILLFALVTIVAACRKPIKKTKKPVIYLYPTELVEVSVSLDFKGKISSTYPEYSNGWKVIAKPNGELQEKETGRIHKYLFYDGDANIYNDKSSKITEGFTVKSSEVVPFLQEKLSIVGLNQTEANDMITFWLPELKEKEYVFIRFRLNEDCDAVSELKIEPTPDQVIRVMMEFQPSDINIPIPEQKLSPVTRKGFVVVEWGGTHLDDLDLNF